MTDDPRYVALGSQKCLEQSLEKLRTKDKNKKNALGTAVSHASTAVIEQAPRVQAGTHEG